MAEDKAKELVETLRTRGLRIATAESLTGGRIAAAITAVGGSSQVFPGGIVSYCDEIKEKFLNVPAQLLRQKGAVSAPVAEAMAAGAAAGMGADLGLSATGLAGPLGDGSENPVGTVYVGAWLEGTRHWRKFVFSGDRDEVQRKTVAAALDLALGLMEESHPV